MLMRELLRLFGQIALLRRGPQDVPASPLLLIVTVLGFIAISFLVKSLLPATQGPWLLELMVEVLFMLGWYAVLLRFVNRPERFLQTATALFGYQIVLAPPIAAAIWLVQQFQKDATWLLPSLAIALMLVVWLVAAGARILKAALEWSMPASVAMTILQTVAGELLVLTLFSPAT